MKITVQELKFSEYNHNLYLNNKEIEFNEHNIICLLITKKDNITKNDIGTENIEKKQRNNTTIISYKDFKIFFDDGTYTHFTIYDNTEVENTMKKLKKITNTIKPLMFDNFLEQSPLVFNSDNYCYIKKDKIEKSTIRNGNKNLGNEFYSEIDQSSFVLPQDLKGHINFNILELDLGIRKIKLNMYMKKTLEYNQLYAPGLISVKQKIKKLL